MNVVHTGPPSNNVVHTVPLPIGPPSINVVHIGPPPTEPRPTLMILHTGNNLAGAVPKHKESAKIFSLM